MFNNGSEFEEFYKSIRKDLYGFILSLVDGDKEHADNIYQNTLENAEKYWDTVRDESKRRSWMFSIAKKETGRYFAKLKKKPNPAPIEIEESENEIYAINAFENSIDKFIKEELLAKALNSVDEVTRKVLVGTYFLGYSQKEIAEIYDINYSNVRSIHRRGTQKIKKILEEEGYYYE